MKTYKIYTAGKMGGLDYKSQMEWRLRLEDRIKFLSDKKVIFIHPPKFYDYDYPNQEEAKRWEINQLLTSDIVVINLDNISSSIGTIMELAMVYALNNYGGKHISIIGIGNPNTDHPWILSSIDNTFENSDFAADYINEYLLF